MGHPAPARYRHCPDSVVEADQAGVVLRPVRWGWSDGIWATLAGYVVTVVAVLTLTALSVDLTGVAALPVLALPWLLAIGWTIVVTRRGGNGPRIDLGLSTRPRDLAWGVGGGFVSLAVAMVLAALTSTLFGEFGSNAGEQAESLADTAPAWVLVAFALAAVSLAPIAEELIYRGLIWSGLAKRGLSAGAATMASAAIFAALHLEPTRFLLLFGIGVVLGVVRWRAGSLTAPTIAHAVNNTPGALGMLALL